ncbi:MAG: transposase, partial [Alphaproteobacteria bacterium]
MSQKSSVPPTRVPAEKLVRDIRRATRKHHSAEDKIRIVLEGLRGEESIAALCRREAIAESLYYAWSKEFLEAGKRRLAGDTARAATSDEVKVDLSRIYAAPHTHLGACLIMAVGFFFTLTPARFLVRVPLCLSCCLVELEDVVGGADHGPF